MTKETKFETTSVAEFDTLTKTPLCAPKTSSVNENTSEAKNGLKSPILGLKLNDGYESFVDGENYTFTFSAAAFDDNDFVAKTFDKAFPTNDSTYSVLDRFSSRRNGEILFFPFHSVNHDRWYVFDDKAKLVCVMQTKLSTYDDGKDCFVVSFTYSEALHARLNKFVTRLKSYVLANHFANDDDDDSLFIENRFEDCSYGFEPSSDFVGF